MGKYVVRRLLQMVLVLFGASIILFGTFVALGENLRYVITPPLFSP